ncbi:MAG: HAD family hydrolase, partial [Ruminiclostridium sp.]
MFTYPLNSAEILKKRKSLKKQLLADGTKRITKKIAVLGGSTTNNIVDVLELFLLDYGIEPVFYQSEYGRYWQDAMFGNPQLDSFQPDVIYIHTSSRNITAFPDMAMSREQVDKLFGEQCDYFRTMWEKLA